MKHGVLGLVIAIVDRTVNPERWREEVDGKG